MHWFSVWVEQNKNYWPKDQEKVGSKILMYIPGTLKLPVMLSVEVISAGIDSTEGTTDSQRVIE